MEPLVSGMQGPLKNELKVYEAFLLCKVKKGQALVKELIKKLYGNEDSFRSWISERHYSRKLAHLQKEIEL